MVQTIVFCIEFSKESKSVKFSMKIAHPEAINKEIRINLVVHQIYKQSILSLFFYRMETNFSVIFYIYICDAEFYYGKVTRASALNYVVQADARRHIYIYQYVLNCKSTHVCTGTAYT